MTFHRSNPESLRMMLQMSAMMQEGGVGGGFPAPGNPGGFPAPGMPGNASNDAGNPTPGSPAVNPPFASMLGPVGASGATTGEAGGAGAFDPAILQQLFGMGAGAAGGGAAGGGAPNPFGATANPFGTFGGAPADTRPPEERFQLQLQVS
jgi:ubiquilin